MSLIEFEEDLRKTMPKPSSKITKSFSGVVFRNVKQKYATKNGFTSTDGSIKFSPGRYHIMNKFGALYLSCDLHSCLQEVIYYGNYLPSKVSKNNLPRTFVGIEVNIGKMLDLTDSNILKMMKIPKSLLMKEWENEIGTETQIIGKVALEKGFEAIKVPSARFLKGYSLNLLDDGLQTKVTRLLKMGNVKVVNANDL